MSLALHHRQDISYDPEFAVRDHESCLMGMLLLVFSTVPVKLYFTMCCQTPVLFKQQTLRTSVLIIIQIAGLEKKIITIFLESVQLDRQLLRGTLVGFQVYLYGILEILCQEIFSSNEFTFLPSSRG